MKLDQLLAAVEPAAVSGSADIEIRGVAADSRKVRRGCLFVALPGLRQDGWSFADDAVSRGAVAVVSGEGQKPRTDVCHVRVRDPRRALADLACAFHGRPADSLCMVGITGTNGKTTTAYMIRNLLRDGGLNPGLLSTVAYEIGDRTIPAGRTTPEAPDLQSMLAEMVQQGCRSGVMETSSHALVQERTRGIDFDVAVFTNLTRDHLDYHGTVEAYFEAKSRLFRGLGRGRKKAAAVVNVDDPWGRRLLAIEDLRAEVVTWGMDPSAAVRADDIRLAADGSRFRVKTPWGEAAVRSRLLGRFNVGNMLAAMAAGGRLGLDVRLMAETLGRMTGVAGRLEELATGRGYQVFVDYAHTDDALANVLATLRDLKPRRLVAVFGCGGNRDRTKRPAMGRVVASLADVVILTSDNPRDEDPNAIIREIQAGIERTEGVEVVEDRAGAIERAMAIAQPGDIVLIAGKGHERFQEFAKTTIPFDDRQVARACLDRDVPG